MSLEKLKTTLTLENQIVALARIYNPCQVVKARIAARSLLRLVYQEIRPSTSERQSALFHHVIAVVLKSFNVFTLSNDFSWLNKPQTMEYAKL